MSVDRRCNQVWVDANFKEASCASIRIGQPVKLEADVYGKKVEYRGTVAGLGAGTGAAFALLPAQNATGNWIKVVQRVPVRIALDPAQLAAHPLRVGLSMDAQVDVSDRTARCSPMRRAPRRWRRPRCSTQLDKRRRRRSATHHRRQPRPPLGRQRAARRPAAAPAPAGAAVDLPRTR